MKIPESIQLRDWSRGNVRTVQSAVAPQNSVKLAVNMDSDKELGSLVSRLGTNIVGVQAVASGICYGLSYFRDTVGTSHKLFGVFSDGVNNDIYDMVAGTKSLEDDTKELKTRFCTFLDSIVRVNGTDAAKAYNGTAWVTTGGAFDLANMPTGTVVIEWKDRVYTAGVSTSPSILFYSSIADPTTRTVSWTLENGQIEMEQEDGGGAITALEKVPGYLLIFKERSMKRWDGNSTYPEDLVGLGAPSQEAVCRGRGNVFVANQEGFWMTNGETSAKISRPIQDIWDAIPAANISSIATFCDETYAYAYIGDITVGDNSLTNVCVKYNIDSQSVDIYSYYSDFTVFTWYLSSSQKVIVAGDKNGQALQINTGNTDYHSTTQPIFWSVETQDLEFGSRGKVKEADTVFVYTKNVTPGELMARANSDRDKDWKSFGNVTDQVEKVQNKISGNWLNFKLTGASSTGQVTFQGLGFPEKSINVVENAK